MDEPLPREGENRGHSARNLHFAQQCRRRRRRLRALVRLVLLYARLQAAARTGPVALAARRFGLHSACMPSAGASLAVLAAPESGHGEPRTRTDLRKLPAAPRKRAAGVASQAAGPNSICPF